MLSDETGPLLPGHGPGFRRRSVVLGPGSRGRPATPSGATRSSSSSAATSSSSVRRAAGGGSPAARCSGWRGSTCGCCTTSATGRWCCSPSAGAATRAPTGRRSAAASRQPGGSADRSRHCLRRCTATGCRRPARPGPARGSRVGPSHPAGRRTPPAVAHLSAVAPRAGLSHPARQVRQHRALCDAMHGVRHRPRSAGPAQAAAGAGWAEPARAVGRHAVARGDVGEPAAAGGGGRAQAVDAVDAAAGADGRSARRRRGAGTSRAEARPRPSTGGARTAPAGERARRVAYAPDLDGAADPGEIVWTWVPYEEDDGRGKDRPVLVVGREGRDLVGLMLSSQSERADDRNWVGIGAGQVGRRRDGRRTCGWTGCIEVGEHEIRREGAVLDESAVRPRRRRAAVALRLVLSRTARAAVVPAPSARGTRVHDATRVQNAGLAYNADRDGRASPALGT